VTRPFIVLVSFLLVCVALASGHYITHTGVQTNKVLNITSAITQIPSASLSVAWYEPRIRLYEEAHNPAYPQMQPIDRLDFVYAK